MKKSILFLMGLFLIFFISFNFANAETLDNTPPVINSFNLVNNDFIGGQEVLLNANIYDDVSGWESLHLIFIKSSDNTFTNDNNYQLTFQSSITSNNYYSSLSTMVIQDTTYKFYSASIIDKAGNNICYTYKDNNDSGVEGCIKTLDYYEINVKSNNKEQNLKKYEINKTEFNLNEKAKFEVELNDANDISIVQINYHHENTANNIDNIILERIEGTNKYVGELELKYVGKYNFSSLSIIYNDLTCETNVYENSITGSSCTLYKKLENNKYNIMVNGEKIKDNELPSFVSINFEKDVIQAPGNIKLYVRTSDNVEVSRVSGSYTKLEDFDKSDIPQTGFSCNKKETNLFECNIEFSQYSESGTFKIREIQIVDSSGNMSFNYYGKIGDWIEYDKPSPNGSGISVYRKLPEYTFKIEKNLNSDVTSSTISKDLLDKINKSSDNAVISIDCTNNQIIKKEIFDAIKGTNKTISVETNGIQWIFKGKDITNNTKDINVSSTISLVDTKTSSTLLNKIFDKINIINISFHSNGLLPGIAKIRVKADYTFRNIIGTKNLYVFYLDESNGMIRYISKTLNMTKDGYYEFYIAHNSKYIISSEQPKKEYVNTTTIDQKIENLNNSNSTNENNNNNNINNNTNNNSNNDNSSISNNDNISNDIDKENDNVIEEEITNEKEELENENIQIDNEENNDKVEDGIINNNKEDKNDNNHNNHNKDSNFITIILMSLSLVLLIVVGIFIYKRRNKINVKNT